MLANAITFIISLYHVGLRDHRVGNRAHQILSQGLVQVIERQGVHVRLHDIEAVDGFGGEVGRSFEVIRRTSRAVSEAVSKNTFPLVLSDNCMATVGAACRLQIEDPGFIYFEAVPMTKQTSPNTIDRISEIITVNHDQPLSFGLFGPWQLATSFGRPALLNYARRIHDKYFPDYEPWD